MAKSVAAFETDVDDGFEDVALLPNSDQPQHSSGAAPSWKSKLFSWLPSDAFTGREGFAKLDQTDDASEVSRQTGMAHDMVNCYSIVLHLHHSHLTARPAATTSTSANQSDGVVSTL